MVNIRIDDHCDESTAESLVPVLASAVFEQLDSDIVMWEHKRHLPHPAFNNPNERVIGKFRRWYARYYDDNASPTPASEALAQSACA